MICKCGIFGAIKACLLWNGEDISWWRTKAGMRDQYFDADYNMNGQVDNTDKDDIWFPSDGMNSQIPGSKKSNNGIDK